MQHRLILGYICTGLILGCFIGLNPCHDARAGSVGGKSPDLENKLARLTGSRDAVVVAAPDGKVLAAVHADQMLIPASVLKVLTSLAAIHYLGSDYRYPTDFYKDNNNNLWVKGYGDPLLVSERLQSIAGRLAALMEQVQDIVMDDSYFVSPIVIPGRTSKSLEPYDAPNGALCVNFNTVFFERRKGRWVSAEEQTPLLPWVIPKIEASGLSNGRITLAGTADEGGMYAGELFRYFMVQAGIVVKGGIVRGKVDPGRQTLVLHELSKNRLSDIISDLLEFSNNFIANQLMLTMGAQEYGEPATVEKGLRALRHYYSDVLGITSGHIAEASGISRRNRVSARIMLQLLLQFQPHHRLMRRNGRHWYKTGHLKGIRTQAGYLVGGDLQLYPYVVLVNTPGKTTHRLISEIEKLVR